MLKYLGVLLVMLSLTACGTSQPKANMALQSVSYLNPDANGRASPVVVTIYELASESNFKNAKYIDLANNPGDALGNYLLDKRTIEVRPGQKITVTEPLSPNTKYLGITAAFRNIATADWKTMVALPEGKSKVDLSIILESQRIMVKVK